MSGGHFSYDQYKILEIADEIERIISRMGKPKHNEGLYMDDDFYVKYPHEKFYYQYPADVVDRMKRGVDQLKLAHAYVQRIDWLLSGDDDDESFLERLRNDINNLKLS